MSAPCNIRAVCDTILTYTVIAWQGYGYADEVKVVGVRSLYLARSRRACGILFTTFSMKSAVNSTIVCVAIGILALCGAAFARITYAASCSNSFDVLSAPLDGFAAVWNTQSPERELLVRGTDCKDDAAQITVGSAATYSYGTAYHWTGTTWSPVPLGGTSITPGWYKGAGTTSVPLVGTSTTYVVAYTCSYAGGAYKCGCRDAACSASAWQLQGVSKAVGGPTRDLEAPPAMTRNPVVFEDVCPGDVGWPTYTQMSGRDVKIVLPKDRTCTQRAVVGGYDATPAGNIWIVGGEIDFYSSDTQGSAGITARYWDGTLFVEGVDIDMNNSCNDGIRTYFAKGDAPRVVIQNSYIRGLGYCAPEGTHGDLYHAQGGLPVVNELLMQNVRGDLITQGIFVPHRDSGHGVLRMTLDHVELRLDERYPSSASAQISTMIYAGPYLMDVTDKYPPSGQRYDEVYLNWWDPHYPASTGRKDITIPAVESYDGAGCAQFSAATTTLAQIEGTWCKGSPFGGTFVPLDRVGRAYDRAYFVHE